MSCSHHFLKFPLVHYLPHHIIDHDLKTKVSILKIIIIYKVVLLTSRRKQHMMRLIRKAEGTPYISKTLTLF